MLLNSINYSQKSIFSTQSQKKEASPSFQGFTKYVINTPHNPHQFFSAEDFLKIAFCFKSKIVGKLPKQFLSYYPEKPSEVFKFFDEFALMARNMGDDKKLLVHFDVELPSGKKLQVKNLGKGSYGNVYKLNAGDKDFAFKAFYDRDCAEFLKVHGPVAETRTYLHFCDKEYKDINKFHIANVADGKNWQISEFIDEEIAKRKKGANFKDAHPELSFGDNGNKNKISEVRIDMGGILKKGFDLSVFAEKDREKIFYEKLNSRDFKERKNIANQIKHLPKDDGIREKAFYDVLNSEHSEVRAGISSQIRYLSEKNGVREKAFYDVLNSKHFEVQAGISSQIEGLPTDGGVREKAFYDVLNSKHPEVRAGISSQIRWAVTGKAREKAFYDVLNSEHPEVRAGISSQIEGLPIDGGIREKAFYDVLNSEHPEVRAGISSQIEWLSIDGGIREKAFYDVLNSEHPEVRAGISSQIEWLPIDGGVMEKAFYAVLNSEHPEVHEGVSNQIKFLLFEKDMKDAQLAVINKFTEGHKTFKVTNVEIEKVPD